MRGVSTYCGPAAVAACLGITRQAAAERLLAERPRSRGSFFWRNVARAVGIKNGRDNPRVTYYPKWNGRMTLAKWLQLDGRDAIIFVSSHFVYVKGGKVVEDNGWPARRGRVKVVILTRGLTA